MIKVTIESDEHEPIVVEGEHVDVLMERGEELQHVARGITTTLAYARRIAVLEEVLKEHVGERVAKLAIIVARAMREEQQKHEDELDAILGKLFNAQ